MPNAAASANVPGPAGRALAWLSEEPVEARARVLDFQRFLLVYGAVRSILWASLAEEGRAFLLPAALGVGVAAVFALRGRSGLRPARWALPFVAGQALWRFPFTANHLYLEVVCLSLLALVRRGAEGREERDEAALALGGLRAVTAAVLFHTGLQKVFYGHYFHGDFLAFMAGAEARFGRVFQWLLPDGEVARLASLDRNQTGAGPYRVEAPLFVLASNLVWIAELSLPVLLVVRRTRWLAALGAIGLMVGIQVAALELGFALLFVNLLLLFLPGRWNARLFPAFAGLLLYALAALAGLVPGDPAAWNLL